MKICPLRIGTMTVWVMVIMNMTMIPICIIHTLSL